MNNRGAMFAQAARGPVLLIIVGILFALQQAGILPVWRSWPLLIIAIGVMKLIERMLGGPVPYGPTVAGPVTGYQPGYAPGARPYAPGTQAYTAGNRPPEGQPK